ncbi:winged helix-turn-helix transcriptional regulator [Streptomyces thermocarboxydus]
MPRFSVDCPSRPILDQVADKWSMMVLAVLERPTRFNEIKRQLEGVTQRVLTQTLRRLERNGLIRRQVLETSPSAWSTPDPARRVVPRALHASVRVDRRAQRRGAVGAAGVRRAVVRAARGRVTGITVRHALLTYRHYDGVRRSPPVPRESDGNRP